MARPREFDRTEALQKATKVFWDKGYAATSTDHLLKEMNIGRQSLYNAFGDKRKLYLEALESYQDTTVAGHVRRLTDAESPLEGIRQLLAGIAPEDDELRSLGCLGVGSVSEFGPADPELARLRDRTNRILGEEVSTRIRAAQALGEIDESVDVADATGFVLLTMTGLQVSARAGADVASMRRQADFAVDRLAARS
ncbi:TetR/AcrR family transcriptional regulator [Lentzea sp. JNUCC 0626]|uniref:TetR/AcrR family transcriptional regulator n=1 Tax=Lentzea sp. JNUCC 0626 TaxID=3367513 RepID=UPI003749F418